MTRTIRTLLIGFIVTISYVVPAWAEKRVALVIGNSAYTNVATLENPRNDAKDIAAALRRLNFEVMEGTNLDKDGMSALVRKYAKALKDADVSLFYYAGHGLQVNGVNYLAPVDAALNAEADLDFDMLPLTLVIKQMERSKSTNLVFLDACRDNPLLKNLARSMTSTRSVSLTRGLARVETGSGTMISYSTAPGHVALDGSGRNSPFTKALLANIETKGVSISEMMIKVRNQVMKLTANKQVPWENSSLTGQFYFKPGDGTAVATASKPQQVASLPTRAAPAVHESTFDHTFWVSIKDSKDEAEYKAYLRAFPNGAFAGIAKAKIESLSRARAIEVEASKTPKKTPANQQLALANPQTAVPGVPSAIQTVPTHTQVLPAISARDAAWGLQVELKRVGCYVSRVDGAWGPGSDRAWRNFKRHAGLLHLANQPSLPLIQTVKGYGSRVCPVTCGRGFFLKGGRCHRVHRVVRRKRAAPRRRHRRNAPPPRQHRQQRDNSAAAAVVGGLIGLGVGIAIGRRR